MKKVLIRLFELLFAAMLIVSVGGWFALGSMYPEKTFVWYPVLPVMFSLMGIATILLLSANYKKDGLKLANLYMILKLAKFVLIIACFLTAYFVIKEDFRVFGFTLAAYYAVYIGLETYIFYCIEKERKKNEAP